MSMVCFELSRELHEQEKAVRGIQIADADSLCNYLKGFWEFIYNHKMFGCVYDIYSDDIEVRRENGFVLRGIPAVEHAVMRLCSAFPDLKAEVATIFASSQGENRYQVWMRYYCLYADQLQTVQVFRSESRCLIMPCGEFEVHHLFIPKGNALSPQTVAA